MSHHVDLAALPSWLDMYVAVSFHHLSFTTFEFVKDKCYHKVPVSAYISCTKDLSSSELHNFRSLFATKNQFDILMILVFSLLILSES